MQTPLKASPATEEEKRKQEEKHRQEGARALRSGLEASRHACTGFAALEAMGKEIGAFKSFFALSKFCGSTNLAG
jgi:hypothetical protein